MIGGSLDFFGLFYLWFGLHFNVDVHLSAEHVVRFVAIKSSEDIKPVAYYDRLMECSRGRLKIRHCYAASPGLSFKNIFVNVIKSFLNLVDTSKYVKRSLSG